MKNQDTIFQQFWSVRVHLTPQFLQKLTVVGRSYSRTTRYPFCRDHTFTIVSENHHLFHVRLGPLEFFQSRGRLASPLTGLRFQFRLEIPDPGFVSGNQFVPFFTKSVQQLLCNFQTSTLLFLTEVMRNPPDGNSTFLQAFSQNAVGRCSLNSSRMCNFFTCHSADFLQYLEHTFHTLVISRRSELSWLRVVLYAQPSHMKALSTAWNCNSVNSFHTTHFHRELWDSIGVFPRNISILMYARWSSLVTVPEIRTAAISTLCHFHVHITPETKYTALASRSSPVQLLKWRDRWRHYLRSVANVCISFDITLLFHTSLIFVFF